MARDDYGATRGGGAKTSKAMAAVGHGSSGGHPPPAAKGPSSALARSNQRQWEYNDVRHAHTPYVFHEYPKHVTVAGVVHVCANAEEEAQALATGAVIREDEERKRLVALAGVKDVKVDHRWKLERIAKAISDAGFDPAANPFA